MLTSPEKKTCRNPRTIKKPLLTPKTDQLPQPSKAPPQRTYVEKSETASISGSGVAGAAPTSLRKSMRFPECRRGANLAHIIHTPVFLCEVRAAAGVIEVKDVSEDECIGPATSNLQLACELFSANRDEYEVT